MTSLTFSSTEVLSTSQMRSKTGAHLSGCHRKSAARNFCFRMAPASAASTPETEGNETGHGMSLQCNSVAPPLLPTLDMNSVHATS